MGNACRPKTKPVKNANLVLEPDEVLKEKAHAIEKEIIITIGLKIDEDVFIKNIPIAYFGSNYIHTIICYKENKVAKPNILIIHGYQGTGVLFYKLFNHFVSHFNVYCIDMLGMGLSSRPQIKFDTPQEYIDFFVNSIEIWRNEMKLEEFYLIGHSLGGYFSAIYTLRYPERVKQLTLLSPAGITDFSKDKSQKIKVTKSDKCILRIFKFFGINKLTLQEMSQNSIIMSKVISRYIKNHIKVPKQEKLWIGRLLNLLLKFPYDLNWTIFYIFDRPLPIAKIPIEDQLIELKTHDTIDIYYGEIDWMDKFGAMRLLEKLPQKFRIFIIPQFGHNFVIENPQSFQNHFLENFKNRYIDN